MARLVDIFVSSLGILILSPFLLFIALINKVLLQRSILNTEYRIGKFGRPFQLYKFQTDKIQQKSAVDTQVNSYKSTRFGRFLTRTRLSGLPILFNILKGDMSLVGPSLNLYTQPEYFSAHQGQILSYRPGLIRPSSMLLNTAEDQEISIDLEHLRGRTLKRDLSLIFQKLFHSLYRSTFLENLQYLRNRHILFIDILLLSLLPINAYLLLGYKPFLDFAGGGVAFFTIMALVVKLVTFYEFGLYNRYWHFANSSDLFRIALAGGATTIILLVIFSFLKNISVPLVSLNLITPSLILIDGLMTLLVITGCRFGAKALYESIRQRSLNAVGQKVLIIGAGEAGSMAVREIQANPQINLTPIGFVDDDFSKVGTLIEGLSVLGTTDDALELIKIHFVKKVIVAIPSAPLSRQHALISRLQKQGHDVWNFPGLYQILAGYKAIKQIPKIDYNQLLNRKPVLVAMDEVGATLKGKTILVTGAGGSIGSELCRQIAVFCPEKLILLGHGENSIFEVNMSLALTCPQLKTYPEIIDVRDTKGIDKIVGKYRPDIIFHAAAHKHVPFMETNISEAITNNILGTWNLVRAAQKYNVNKFLFISSDKAVNPVNVMGATKRISELLVKGAAQDSGQNFMAVRFGNVLGSRGSVLPIFARQIEAGGPLTITHPEMRRYFMTIPEAVQLVLSATTLSKKSEIFTLDMGEQVRILDLAENLLTQAGLKLGYDIDIVFSGIRPGEKLMENLFLKSETYVRTKFPQIFSFSSQLVIDTQTLEEETAVLIKLAKKMKYEKAIKQMQKIIPEYRPADSDAAKAKMKEPQPESQKIVATPA